MKKQFKKLTFLLVLLLGNMLEIHAQIPTVYYEEDQAISYIFSEEEANVFELPFVDIEPYQQEDIELDEGNNPYRFGAPVEVGLSLTSAEYTVYSEEYKVWKVSIYSAEAKSLNLVFENIELPEGAAIFIYDESGRVVQGPIVQEMIPEGGVLGSNIFRGKKIFIECAQSLSATSEPNIFISKVVHGYRETLGSDGDYGASEACNVDVDCPVGDDWCVEKRSTTRILINNNAHCTGGAINNAASDLNNAYILTANHCVTASNNLGNWQFEFHYKNPSCGATSYSGITWALTGATLRAGWGGTDFALLELNNYDPNNNIHRLMGVHFAGWNRSPTNPTEATLLHHPSGDVMKISVDVDGVVPITWPLGMATTNGDWRAFFSIGTTEGSSSGGPLFDQNHRIVGQLRGKDGPRVECDSPNGYFGRLNVSWNGNGTPATRLSDWLGPVVGNTVDAFSAPIIYHNEQITSNSGLHTATHEMELEGGVNGYPNFGPFFSNIFPTNNQPFTISSSGEAAYQAGQSISVLPGVHLDNGASVHLFIEPVICDDGLDYGYLIADDTPEMIKQQQNTLSNASLKLSKSEEINLQVFPNPASDVIKIQLGKPYAVSLSIVNSQGILIRYQERFQLSKSPEDINISNLPAGLYIVTVELEDGRIQSKRFVRI